jgi:hypothetical protein
MPVVAFNVAEVILVDTAFVFNKVDAVKVVMVAFVMFAAPAVIFVSIKFVVVKFTVVKVPATERFPETAKFAAVTVVALRFDIRALAEVRPVLKFNVAEETFVATAFVFNKVAAVNVVILTLVNCALADVKEV